ncbi:MAG: sulfite exporter TauE/SafE family protein [Firmicutes bacterium]|nr:sulfite exporter TauE/SafE family protein [Bacillota bacterium]
MYLAILFFVSLVASSVGAICGAGGGVIIKPILDAIELTDVSSASFLSACNVFVMASYSVLKEIRMPDRKIDIEHVTPLALGAAVGGVTGKVIFERIKLKLPFLDMVGAYQAILLGTIAVGILVYTIKKNVIQTKQISSKTICALFGLALGTMSGFLGIGGGPINLVVLMYFFSMDTKTAAQNSLFIIFISQLFSLAYTICSGNIPEVMMIDVIVMVIGGYIGGTVGRKIGSKIDNNMLEKLFIMLLCTIALLSVYNFFNHIC